MPKITSFQQIPRYTRSGSYEIDVALHRIPSHISVAIDEGLQIDPDFQRDHVWTEKQQIAWLEFFLRGGQTSRVLYFNHSSWNKLSEAGEYVIVDGKQRLAAIMRFCNNEIQVFGSYFNEFTDKPNITVKININDLPTRADVLRWYIEFNSGGVVHSDKEINRVKRLLKEELKGIKNDKAK